MTWAHAAATVPIRLERSMLFVPAARWPMIEKAASSAADAVCIDLEDSVAPDEKVASRANVIRAFTELHFGRRARMFRINDLETPLAYRDVIEVVEAAGERIDLIMLPKANSPEDVTFLDKLLTQVEAHRGFSRRIGIEAQIETAAGFLAVRETARASSRLEALIFGPGDYAASMQMPSAGIGEFDHHDEIYPGHRWHAVMNAIVAAARANGLRCLDGPYAAHRDDVGLQRSCSIARALGFDGKQCIHPNQLSTANSIFTPPADEVALAKQVMRAYEQAVADKKGVASLNGKMIDAANVRMAQCILEKNRLIASQTHE
jgi:citrate lyase subunit beta/citryl-CoA lyase